MLLGETECGKELDEPCNPGSDPGDCDAFQGYVCVRCQDHGYSAAQGCCYFGSGADTSHRHACEQAWGPSSGGGQGGSSCSGEPSGYQAAWTGSTQNHAQYNCQAASLEQARCNPEGVQANCDILRGYGTHTLGRCTSCR